MLSSSVRCEELHNNECTQELREDWVYCPHCGSGLVSFEWAQPSRFIRIDDVAPITCDIKASWVSGPDIVRLKEGYGVKLSAKSVKLGVANPSVRVSFISDIDSAIVQAICPKMRRTPSEDSFKLGQSEVERHDIVRELTLIRTACGAPTLRVLPELIRVEPGIPSKIRLEGINCSTLHLNAHTVPKGWHLRLSDPYVREGRFTEAELLAAPDAEDGELTISDSTLAVSCSAWLVRRRPPRLAVVPTFVVGIDFGTSGTSVGYRYNLVDDSVVEFSGGNRAPSVLFMANPSAPSTWVYGKEALASRTLSGLFIQELKRLLWAENDVVEGTPYSATEILAYYLEDLVGKLKIELSAVLKRPLQGCKIEWRLSIPVLEESVSERYKARLHAAARSAKLHDFGDIRFQYEPEAALMSVLARGDLDDRPVQKGDRIMIVDSGGGTTDVCFGELVREGNHWALVNPYKYPIGLTEARDRGSVISEDTFGGGDVTRFLGSIALHAWGSKLDNGTDLELQEALKQFLVFFEREQPGIHSFDMSGFGIQQLSPFPTKIDAKRYWSAHCPAFLERVEGAKLHLATTDPPPSEATLAARTSELGNTAPMNLQEKWIEAEAVEEVRDEYRRQLAACANMEVAAGRKAPKWIAFVGGNSGFEQLRPRLPGYPMDELMIPSDRRQLAVVDGLCGKTSNEPLFETEVKVELDGADHALVHYTPDTLTKGLNFSQAFTNVPPSAEVSVKVLDRGVWWVLDRHRLATVEATVEVIVRMTRGHVIVSSNSPGINQKNQLMDCRWKP